MSEAFGVDLFHVIPVSNYFEEVTPNEAKNAMSLFNLWRVFKSGKEYIERRWSKKETRFFWKRLDLHKCIVLEKWNTKKLQQVSFRGRFIATFLAHL